MIVETMRVAEIIAFDYRVPIDASKLIIRPHIKCGSILRDLSTDSISLCRYFENEDIMEIIVNVHWTRLPNSNYESRWKQVIPIFPRAFRFPLTIDHDDDAVYIGKRRTAVPGFWVEIRNPVSTAREAPREETACESPAPKRSRPEDTDTAADTADDTSSLAESQTEPVKALTRSAKRRNRRLLKERSQMKQELFDAISASEKIKAANLATAALRVTPRG
jgi:hypothetical protein